MAKSTEIVKSADTVAFPISSSQTLKASKALISHIKKQAKESAATSTKRNLLEDDDDEEDESNGSSLATTPIWLTVTTKLHIRDSSKLKPHRIALPHSLDAADPERTICLIVADPQRAYKDLVASESFPAELRKRITRVVDVTHLKAKFRVYEAQRKLYAEHDVFLADDRIINRLPKALGKTFYKSTAKRPVPVVVQKGKGKNNKGKENEKEKKKKDRTGEKELNARTAPEIAKEIEAALGAAVVHLSPSEQTSVKVGFAGWKPEDIAANAEAVARSLVKKHVPHQWNGVRAVFLRGNETASLPIWQTAELWVDGEKDVLAEGSEQLKAIQEKRGKLREKANVGKKRKAIDEDAAAGEEEKDAEKQVVKKAKKERKEAKAAKAVVSESNDAKLDLQIKEHKRMLKKQKKAAKEAIDV